MAATQIREMRPTHDSVLDLVLADPRQTLAMLSAKTGYSVSWLSQMMRSDCFRVAYDARRGDIEAEVMMSVTSRLEAVTHLAIDKITEVLTTTTDNDVKIDAFDKVLHRAGYAPQAKQSPAGAGSVTNNNLFVVTREELATLRGEIIEGSVNREPLELPNALPAT
jgi:uncharacterized NAD(P)/FAD-binding protein YdhS